MRLDKFLADCGAGTRSEVKKLIKSGAVRVIGLDKASPDTKIDEKSSEVYLNGEPIGYKKYVYLMLNKPENCLSATQDRYKAVVTDFVPPEFKHFDVFPIGRLDIDTVGLCILTNDGGLAHRLLSPARHIPKAYLAEVDGELSDDDVRAFESGMDLGDFITKPSRLEIISASEDKSLAKVTIFEGKFHQIKRMFKDRGREVTYLKRIAMNRLLLDGNLSEGEIRELTTDELELLTYDTE